MRIENTNIPEVLILVPEITSDERGFFLETYNQRELKEHGIAYSFVQDNLSHSTFGTLRGLHYQMIQTQGKLVRAVTGEVFNVALDMRRSSKSFGKWVGLILSAESKKSLWVPPGFAHGLLALSQMAEVMYKTTDYYHPQSQRSVRWNDPSVGIAWPIPQGMPVKLSEKDRSAPLFSDAETFS